MNDLDFTGRVAVITGAGRGIGRAHALMLASRGAQVVVNDVGGDVHGDPASSGAADDVANAICADGGRAVASHESVAHADGGRRLIDEAMAAFGRVDIVIHNAGILRDRSFAKLSDEDIDAVLAVHLGGAFNVLRPAWPLMKSQGYGRVLLTSSASGLFGNFGQTNYGAAKVGLVGLMHVLAVEGAPHGIRVNAIAPTARTRMTQDLLGDLTDRFDPDHVAAVATYLVSERCSLTHHILSAGGGRVARVFVGTTPGWYAGGAPATPEQIEDAIPRILALDDYVVPADGSDEVALITRALTSQPRSDPAEAAR